MLGKVKQFKTKILGKEKEKEPVEDAGAPPVVVAVRPKSMHVPNQTGTTSLLDQYADNPSSPPGVKVHAHIITSGSSSGDEGPGTPTGSTRGGDSGSQSGKDSPKAHTPKEKDSKPSRLGSFFRSASKSARQTAPTNQEVEAFGGGPPPDGVDGGTTGNAGGAGQGWLDGFSSSDVKSTGSMIRATGGPSQANLAGNDDGPTSHRAFSVSVAPADGTYRTGSLKATPVHR